MLQDLVGDGLGALRNHSDPTIILILLCRFRMLRFLKGLPRSEYLIHRRGEVFHYGLLFLWCIQRLLLEHKGVPALLDMGRRLNRRCHRSFDILAVYLLRSSSREWGLELWRRRLDLYFALVQSLFTGCLWKYVRPCSHKYVRWCPRRLQLVPACVFAYISPTLSRVLLLELDPKVRNVLWHTSVHVVEDLIRWALDNGIMIGCIVLKRVKLIDGLVIVMLLGSLHALQYMGLLTVEDVTNLSLLD